MTLLSAYKFEDQQSTIDSRPTFVADVYMVELYWNKLQYIQHEHIYLTDVDFGSFVIKDM